MAHTLIGSDRVEGTNVYGKDGGHIGKIERIMIDKVSGQVSYAVLSFGGFLGIGHDHFPLPWGMLNYDTGKDGYVVPLVEDQLKDAPRHKPDAEYDWGHRQNVEQIDRYYGGWM